MNVFINCPFDEGYRSCFEALLFGVMACGYRVRCALEDNDAANIRYNKLCELIRESPYSIHDLSRVELGANNLPRFNMPFELGLYQGARNFGGRKQKQKTALILVREPFSLPRYLSDAAGNDPAAHHGDPDLVIRMVRRYLHQRPDGSALPGAAIMQREFQRFRAETPKLAANLHLEPEDIHPLNEYRNYLTLLTAFLTEASDPSQA